jgi:hypothetical protein
METRERTTNRKSTMFTFIQKGLFPPEYMMKVMGNPTRRKIANVKA